MIRHRINDWFLTDWKRIFRKLSVLFISEYQTTTDIGQRKWKTICFLFNRCRRKLKQLLVLHKAKNKIFYEPLRDSMVDDDKLPSRKSFRSCSMIRRLIRVLARCNEKPGGFRFFIFDDVLSNDGVDGLMFAEGFSSSPSAAFRRNFFSENRFFGGNFIESIVDDRESTSWRCFSLPSFQDNAKPNWSSCWTEKKISPI